MPSLEITVEQVIALIKQLPTQEKLAIFSELRTHLGYEVPEMDSETQEWMDAGSGGELPAYEWETEEIPPGKPIRYVPGQGFVIEGGKSSV